MDESIPSILRRLGAMLELGGENPYKARAYATAADALERQPRSVADLLAAGELEKVPGIGRSLARVVRELHETGHSTLLDELRAKVPETLTELLALGLKPPKIRALHQALGVVDAASLKAACEAGRVRALKGFGPKSEQKLLAALERGRDARMLLADALEVGDALVSTLKAHGALRAELAGAVRRRCELVDTLDVVLEPSNDAALGTWFEGGTPTSAFAVRVSDTVLANVHVAEGDTFVARLHAATGSAAYHDRLARLAAERGLELTGEELRRDGRRIALASEESLYDALGLPFIPPELRDDPSVIDAAERSELALPLVDVADIKGLVHCHTVYSDGKNTIEQMAQAAEAMGMEYLTITDHSEAAFYAQGVKVDRLKRQWDEIAAVQEHTKVKLLRGTEADILADGTLDYPTRILEQLDVVIASIHSRLKMDEDAMTRRIVRAMREPLFKIWGHALGRLLQSRDSFACRVEEVLDAIAESPAAIEVNGDPRRLELEPKWIREARARGISFVVSTDAHSVRNLRYVEYGTYVARRGGLTPGEVLNTRSAAEFARAVRPVPGA